MSNYLAIATVTATLRQIIDEALSMVAGGGNVKTLTSRPDSIHGDNKGFEGVNIYLYQVAPNAAFRGSDLPMRTSEGALVQRPQAGLDLYYLLNFYGKDENLTSQLLLGKIVSILHARPVLTRDTIRKVVSKAESESTIPDFIADSDLADQVEQIKFSLLTFDLEELSKLWSVFFQTPYVLSVAYHASVVLIEGEDTPQPTLPVRERQVYVSPFKRPFVEQVSSAEGPGVPILAGDELVIRGRDLQGDITKVRIDDEAFSPDHVSATTVRMHIPDSNKAGIHGLQVVHELLLGTPPVEHRGAESNIAPFVLCPQIKTKPNGKYEISFTREGGRARGSSEDSLSGQVDVTLVPVVGKEQRIMLLMNELVDADPAAYSFPAPRGEEDTDHITIPVEVVKEGSYLVRVQVDGAESPLDVDETGKYSGPILEIGKK